MGCFVALLGLAAPRVALAIIWLFSNALGRAFDSWLLPILGFLLMPYTTLAYVGAHVYRGGVSGGWLVVLVLAVIADLGAWGNGGRTHAKYRYSHQ
ncbi:MAG: hypothetical protein JXL80_00410 [Planctomycetes bacterium]|nr:hypothetical protein [Planctomycetota bacterium]